MTEASREYTYINENVLSSFSERGAKLMSEAVGPVLTEDGIGRVSIYGGLGNGYFEGFSTYEEIASQIEALRGNDRCSAIALFINSPGGAAVGLSDLCSYIHGCDKPVHAYITGMACSAAYAIAAACDSVWMQEDAETGCCGCFAHVVEPTEDAYKKAGFLSRIFRSANAPKKNLSISEDGEAEKYQARVDELGDKYLSMVMDFRGIEDGKVFGEGAVVTAEYAVVNHMADGICTVEEFISKVKETTSSSPAESEGEDKDMDVKTMSADEQKELFCQLCEANPSLLNERVEEAKKAEAERVEALNALRNGTEAVDAVVNAAVAEGKCATDIALDVIKAMKENPAPTHEETRAKTLESLAEATETVSIPVAKSDDQLIEEMASRL